jgi:hypothetical protein
VRSFRQLLKHAFFSLHIEPVFSEVFNRARNKPFCFGQEEFKSHLNAYIGKQNPIGIVFVTGRKNSGKTTAIQSVLSDRRYVAYINWRGENVQNEHQLLESLNMAFHTKEYVLSVKSFDHNRWISFLINVFSIVVPIPQGRNNLQSTMQDIEMMLLYAKTLNPDNLLSGRPVIFIDEIGAIKELISYEEGRPVAEYFMNRLVYLTKDAKLCDVVFSSHDGFMMDVLQLTDPGYTASLIMPDFNITGINRAKQLGFLNYANISHVLEVTSGHASHVVNLFNRTSDDVFQQLESFRTEEYSALQKIYNSGEYFCSYAASSNCYSRSSLIAILRAFLRERDVSTDPEISYITMKRETGVHATAFQRLANLGYLFYNPTNGTIKARNKVFLDVFAEECDSHTSLSKYQHELTNLRSPFSEPLTMAEVMPRDVKREKWLHDRIIQLERQIKGKSMCDNWF